MGFFFSAILLIVILSKCVKVCYQNEILLEESFSIFYVNIEMTHKIKLI